MRIRRNFAAPDRFHHMCQSASSTAFNLPPAQAAFPNAGARECHNLNVVRSRTETCLRDGVAYRVETTWDDESGNSEIREFAPDGMLVRRCDWRIWPDAERRGDQI